MKIQEIIEILDAGILSGHDKMEVGIEVAFASDLMRTRPGRANLKVFLFWEQA